jgi:UDP-2,3-diacylglucosamine hydrolase
MSYTLFISDLHLDESRPQHLAALEQLLEEHRGVADVLYILGDLFETWIGDDNDTAFNLRAVAAFKAFTEAGSKLFFMHGNRDFLLGEDFAHQAGGALIAEGTVVDLYGTQALLMHGDSLCTGDEKYQQFRAMVRQPAWQQGILAKSLAERRAIADGMRMQSQQNNENKADNIMDVTPEEVVRVMEEAGVNDLIHGHTHRPNVHSVQLADRMGTRWVLGDWGNSAWLIRASKDDIELTSFDIA